MEKMDGSKEELQAKKSRVDLSSLPTRQYLDQTVVPILLQGLSYLAKERPADPIPSLANYLLKHKGSYDSSPQNSPPTETGVDSEKIK
ncbi:PREDICTED: protein dpy-30 homolog [Nicrophorus vespilloides]|uniref:Protein dpy-30 homolog n=1 Tax=Nicrophorus vespilloides TaxID=110193 RepID=A0ABM1MMB4_NICVS|nr:PREDICTED: protein dpy-30 homolog [Nicrophorus vespilloides]XP_017775715.1 PREDICTED: protein dpy-30 homolog [Nicrophorus vespilloides]XP_017775717.1 PREDICTED: protein dpy-30 homolog [Nicrophorus vespilloides]XP_017775718.1 PREDICTED: protein dpy-30 homolog [Nicrophorus vespilloides]